MNHVIKTLANRQIGSQDNTDLMDPFREMCSGKTLKELGPSQPWGDTCINRINHEYFGSCKRKKKNERGDTNEYKRCEMIISELKRNLTFGGIFFC